MDAINLTMAEVKKDRIEEAVRKDRGKLLNFIRQRVADKDDAEDILQDVFFQLANGYDMIGSLDKVTSWMYAVARNKITDWYRKKKPEPFSRGLQLSGSGEDDQLSIGNIIPALGNTPEDAMLKSVIWDAVMEALDELPAEQKAVFVWNEFEEKGFKEISEETGVAVNTLISRKRYAVLHLRKRLQYLYKELNY
ncbi:MAG: polymerase sigma factor [Cytophagaceae bacterium]|jgi:RNA polymerase sigma factor (sigma-70 family)|nr:polymerase sigma factor [Cytophagaceae bacterium]